MSQADPTFQNLTSRELTQAKRKEEGEGRGLKGKNAHLVKVLVASVVSDSLRPYGQLLPTRLIGSWDSPGKNTAVGSHSLLQGIFPTQRSNPGLPHCRQIPCHLSHWRSPCIYILQYNYNYHLGVS